MDCYKLLIETKEKVMPIAPVKENKVSLFDLISSLSDAIDLVSPSVVNHHKLVAYIGCSIAKELNLPEEQINDITLAGAVHDVGGLSLKERLDLLAFEAENTQLHCELGYQLLSIFKPFNNVANIVRYHHLYWNDGEGMKCKGKAVSMASHIIHLADRIAVSLNLKEEILSQVKPVLDKVMAQSNKMFNPDFVLAFKRVSEKEFFWFNLISPNIMQILRALVTIPSIELDIDALLDLTKMYAKIIDFRSKFTSTHSSGLAASAEEIARLGGFSDTECKMIRIAGYLHDLGKLAVPAEYLEKPDNLSKDEFNVIKSHAFHTYRLLKALGDFEVIAEWSAYHHECLDGTGYPFHLKGKAIPMGSRIIAVADVFVALTEDRPYRKGMSKEKTIDILQRMADNYVLDPNIVSLIKLNYEDINAIRMAAQDKATEEYFQFVQSTV